MGSVVVEETETGTVFRAALLITGCCIGVGMIGLPVMSAMTGFIPTTLAMILCYFFATGTGLLILEATLWFDRKVNFVSMAQFALGKTGGAMAWLSFLFLFYCLFVAYIDVGGQFFAAVLTAIFQYPVSKAIGTISCVGCVGAIVYAGTVAVSRVNRLFLFCLVASYAGLLFLGLPHINSEQLLYVNWNAALPTLPILLLCFGYQSLVPSLTYYVRKNIAAMRTAIFIGNLIPFVVYFLWNFVILGLLPDPNSTAFIALSSESEMVTELLEKTSHSQSVLLFAKIFSFFAVLGPFVSCTMAFVDFLKDGLKLSKDSNYEILIYGLVLIPPMLLTLSYPHLFLKALGIAGGFADVMLFGILPTLIVWKGRYVKKIEGPYTVAGGKFFLSVIFFLSVSFLIITQFVT